MFESRINFFYVVKTFSKEVNCPWKWTSSYFLGLWQIGHTHILMRSYQMKISDILPISPTKKQLIALVMYKAAPSMLRIHIIFNSRLAKWLNGFFWGRNFYVNWKQKFCQGSTKCILRRSTHDVTRRCSSFWITENDKKKNVWLKKNTHTVVFMYKAATYYLLLKKWVNGFGEEMLIDRFRIPRWPWEGYDCEANAGQLLCRNKDKHR